MTIDAAEQEPPSGAVPRAEQQELVTRSAFRFTVRPAVAADEAALAEFFTHVAQEDLRFRFLTAVRHVGHDMLRLMTNVDHARSENFLAFDPVSGALIATAMLAADGDMQRGEAALSIRADYKGRGVSWTLLEHIARWAKDRGIKRIESIESRDNHAAIELEREMGFSAMPYPGDATLVLLQADLA